jgi:polyphenol oxidase
MHIIKSSLLNSFPNIIFGFSTKIGLNRQSPFWFNMSLTVGDSKEKVLNNREAFFNQIGLTTSQIAIQKQVHSDIITLVEKPGLIGESDAMITSVPGTGLAISSADCVPIFIYDRGNNLIAAVHSGWRGTQKQILRKTIETLVVNYNSKTDNLFFYIGPSITQNNYEVGEEVAAQFDSRYSLRQDGKIFLNVLQANIDMINNFGIDKKQMEVSQLCSYTEKDLLQSYRRDRNKSGRALGIIARRAG